MSDEDTVTVVVGRFDPLVGRGVLDVLGDDSRVRILDTELEGAALARAVTCRAPQVAILDALAAHSSFARLRSSQATTGVMVLAREPTHAYGMLLLAAGVTCLAWSARLEDILAAVHLTAEGGCVLVANDGARVERRDRSKEPILTLREIEVLKCLTKGRKYAEIALALKISVETVRSHTVSLLRKLKARSKRDLIGLSIHWIE